MPDEQAVKYKVTSRSVLDLTNLYEKSQLNLEPGFQRKSVWLKSDRLKLIDSILRGYPLPAIFLYKDQTNGDIVFDVIDGKQRLESIFMFTGAIRGKSFSVKAQLKETDPEDNSVSYKSLMRQGIQNLITGYEIPVIEIDGELSQIIDLFVRINSTGKSLTGQEKRHAAYSTSELLKAASRLATKFEGHLVSNRILSKAQVARMKHIELICEIMLSLLQGDVLNKKSTLDKVMATNSLTPAQVKKASLLTTTALNRLFRIFPEIKTTRFHHSAEFYSLAVLIGLLEQGKYILTNKKQNVIAWKLLQHFGTEVDKVSELQRKAKGTQKDQDIYRNYLFTVTNSTDTLAQRKRRQDILRNLLGSIFAGKPAERTFSLEQRRILWNTSDNRACKHPGCKTKLTWDDFTIDHIVPYSKGGQSNLKNADIMCRQHNSAKGNRTRRTRPKRA